MLYLLSQAVDRMANRSAAHEAIRFGDLCLTYGDLSRQSNRLAHALIDQGVKRGDRVGIYMHKCLEVPVAIYGIMKTGAAYVPLDPTAPAARLAFVIRDCGIRHLVTERSKVTTLQEILREQTPLECLIGLAEAEELALRQIPWEHVDRFPGNKCPDVGTIEQDLSYVLYTSGSTGVPKGIMHTHRSALSFAEVAAETYGFDRHDRISNHAPLHFDLTILDFFSSAVAGATTVIIPEMVTKLPASLSQLIAESRLTVFYTAPFALIQLHLHGAVEQRDFSRLRWILFGGEPFPVKHLRDLMKRLPHVRFCNVYGPTETNGCTYYMIPPIPVDSEEPIPIGGLYANAEALVVDEANEPVATGEVGELLIRSPTMMRGYWDREDLNAKTFYRRRMFGQHEDVFHKTGDLVQALPEGGFKFLGRKDRQIKTRGHRVELDEIEAVILTHDAVEEAAIFSVPDGEGSQKIQAAVILKSQQDLSISALSQFLANRLPWYAIPSQIDFVEAFPRTSTDKIDRMQLRSAALGNVG